MGAIVGPVHSCTLPDGTEVPLYVLQFDKGGACTTPRSRQHLYDHLEQHAGTEHAVTDVLLVSHGWNTAPQGAIDTYQGWMTRFATTPPLGRPFRPVVVGVVWPSMWFLPRGELGPVIAADEEAERQALIADIAEDLAAQADPADLQRFHQLATAPHLDDDDARDLMALLARIADPTSDSEGAADAPSTGVLLDAWDELSREGAPAPFRPDDPDAPFVPRQDGGTPGSPPPPQPAGLLGRLPLDALRLASVWRMKDRAAAVGARGVGETLHGILAAGGGDLRSHLVGHSFGCKVLLSAIGGPLQPPLAVDAITSLLLIQPAVNIYALADRIPGRTTGGGYNGVQRLVRQPILTTFTSADLPLRRAFHLGVRRDIDIGEIRIAGDAPPSPYAAMGGYGPAGVDSSTVIDIHREGAPYPAPDTQVVALRAHAELTGHGDHNNAWTRWALHSLLAGIG